MLKKLAPLALVAASVSPAFAQTGTAPTTVQQLAASVDFSDVALALLGIAGTIITLYVVWKGAKFVIGAVRSA